MRGQKQIVNSRQCWASVLRTVSSIFCLPAITIAISLSAHAPAHAQVKLDPVGGPSGNYFEYVCGPGRVLVGVKGHTGVWIDNVQAVCASVEAGRVSAPEAEGPVFGGNGGESANSSNCPGGTVVSGLVLESNKDKPFLGSIKPICSTEFINRNFSAMALKGSGRLSSETGSRLPAFEEFGTEANHQECPRALVAVGILGRAGEFLDAFGLICGPKPVTSPANISNSLLGKEVSFQSSNYSDRYIRHRNALGFIEPATDDLAKQDASFKIVPGLAGRCVSLESHNFSNHFLRHERYRLKLALATDEQLFREDATFCIVTGLADANGVSFESVNSSNNYYIRHRNFELWLDRYDGSDVFRKDATFVVRLPVSAGHRIGVGKVKLPSSGRETRPSEPSRPAPTPTPPFITASPEVVRVSPQLSQGTTTLTWDGGPDHSYAEIWVKVNDADETFMVEQGKGTREVTVEAGKTYLFILEDAGQRLATVTVTVKQ